MWVAPSGQQGRTSQGRAAGVAMSMTDTDMSHRAAPTAPRNGKPAAFPTGTTVTYMALLKDSWKQ